MVDHRKESERTSLHYFECLDRVTRVFAQATDVEELIRQTLGIVREIFASDRTWLLFPCDPDAGSWRIVYEATRPERPGALAMNVNFPMDESVARIFREAIQTPDPITYGVHRPHPWGGAPNFDILSQIHIALRPRRGPAWLLGLHQCSYARDWTPEESRLFHEIAQRLADALTNLLYTRELEQTAQALRDSEALLRKSEAALREADRRKDEFLALLAHELRNPLAPVRNGLHILKLTHDEGQRRQVREMMERQIGQMVRLIDDLMDLSRITRGRVELRRERVELRAVVESALEASGPLIAAAGHALSVRVPGGLFLDADPTRMAQVIANLLNNSAKYTPQGGSITLSADTDGRTVWVQVTDTGVGIPAEMIPRVFDMFTQVGRTLDRAQGGLGIGLTLVRRLVEMHGGSVDVKSPGAGQGTTFTIKLPMAGYEEPEPEPGAGPPKPLARTTGPLRILVVDDDKDEAESLALLMRMGGHKTRSAHTGLAALDVAREFQADLIFLDIGLPGIDGYEVAERLRSEPGYGSAVLVALTGRGGEEDKRRSKAVGFDRHLTKPVAAEHLKRLIEGLSAARAEG